MMSNEVVEKVGVWGGGGQARVKKVIIIDVHVITSVITFFDQNCTLYCCKKILVHIAIIHYMHTKFLIIKLDEH